MKVQAILAGAFSVAALLLSSAPALAATEMFNFADNADGIFAFGTLGIADSANVNGTFDITAITGIVINGSLPATLTDRIGGLLGNSNQPNAAVADGFMYDNVAPLNVNGVLFQGMDTNAIYNLWSNGGTSGELYTYGLPGVPNFDARGTLTLSAAVSDAVPEPATWAMMLIGFAGLGGALRGARRKQGLVAA